MAIDDLWYLKDRVTPSKRHGRGKRYRVRVEGYPSTLHRTKAEAEAVNARRIVAGPPKPESTITVGELLDRWVAGKRHLSPKGLEACELAARMARARWGTTLACDVRTADVQEWVANLASIDNAASAHASKAAGQRVVVTVPAAGSTRHKALQALSGAMRIAVGEKAVSSNPCQGVRAGRQRSVDPSFLTVAELERLASESGEWSALVWFLGTTGLRISEAAALTVGDADAKRGRVRVRRSKNGEARDVPVAASVLAMLDLSRGAADPLFPASRGGRLDVHNWRMRAFRPAASRAGLDGLRIHDLRHTAASLAIASGADVKAVQRMLGHKSAAMTLDLYGHLFDKGLDDVAARLDAMIPGS
ncbi:hypothetical protein GCM10009785_01190 [Brooklawnia cerclae]|uniref:Integrase n=1 Tax=Brooklawnia cerclae TaxID=349934 RepID=A0ABX0SG35_9ACTN|nr:site-specific integrase [Brooklawnia cerclae]NIH56288.1 integrase [Brooklawnia cerclae]